ncbi:MAG: twin-arginine translocation signal domain-containing protein, partial [Tannerella sp.]|nr:twin-arginine translocation signal domain-containing protein [Tannerella sp.]
MNSRRDFFKKAAIAGAGMIAIPTAVSSKI